MARQSPVPRDLAEMNITIQRRAFTFSSKYEIETPSSIYSARKKPFSWSDRIELFASRDCLVATIRGHFLSFRSKYDFNLTEGKVYHFECKKMWKGVYLCEGGEESFRLYKHKGLNYSIFRNDEQIAAFNKNRIQVGGGDRYEVRMNDNANLLVVICMVLAIDSAVNDNDTATVTVDFGNVGPEERPFDRSWEPS